MATGTLFALRNVYFRFAVKLKITESASATKYEGPYFSSVIAAPGNSFKKTGRRSKCAAALSSVKLTNWMMPAPAVHIRYLSAMSRLSRLESVGFSFFGVSGMANISSLLSSRLYQRSARRAREILPAARGSRRFHSIAPPPRTVSPS